MAICHLCLCAISDPTGKLPVCRSCYEQLQKLPSDQRMSQACKVARNMQAHETAEKLAALIEMLEALIREGRGWYPFVRGGEN